MLERSTSFFKSSGSSRFETAVWTAKLTLLSIGVVSTFLLFKVALIPCIFHSILPRFLGCVRACLAPPYIYIIANFIIISIAASSSSADKSCVEEGSSFVESRDVKVTPLSKCAEDTNHVQNDVISFFSTSDDFEIEDSDPEVVVKHQVMTGSKDAFAYSDQNSPPQAEYEEEEEEEEEDSYDDSLDGTWKAIIEGKGMVKKPFLKKSDTWNAARATPAPLAERVCNNQNHQNHEMRKSETFNDRVTTLKARGGIRRETLITSQDSLNARVEAFINKFQNDMRMESQQSDMRYINRVKQQAAATTT